MISTKAKPSCKIHPNKVLREIKINVTIENRSNFWRRSVAIWGKWHWHIWGSQYGIRNCVSYLHVLLHGGDVNFICDLHLVVMAGIQQHLVIELPVPHLTSGILCSLGGVRKGYAHTFKVGLIIYLWSRSTFEADLPLKEILSSTSEAGLPLKQSTSEAVYLWSRSDHPLAANVLHSSSAGHKDLEENSWGEFSSTKPAAMWGWWARCESLL